MSIAGLNIGLSGVRASQVALELTGQNIANVNNPDFTRQRARLENALTISRSFGEFGTGVSIRSIEQIKDQFIELQLQDQTSEFGRDEKIFNVFKQLEAVFAEGQGFGLNERLGSLFNAFSQVANFPEDNGIRTGALGEAQLLASQVQFLNTELDQLRLDLNKEALAAIGEINALAEEIAGYNTEIVAIEAVPNNNANDLRDQRAAAIKELSELINITTNEMNTGAVNISTNGRSIVFAGEFSTLDSQLRTGDELPTHDFILTGSNDVISFTGGKVGGILQARDTEVTSYRDNLDLLARTLIEEVNQIHSDGRGLVGYSTETSRNAVTSNTADLDNAGLQLTPQNGSFDIIVIDQTTGAETTATVTVDLDGAGADDGLDDLATNITAANANLTATANADGTITINAAAGFEFAFNNDTSNILAALGINSFFTGSDASNIGVNQTLVTTPSLLAAANSGNPGDNSNALQLANLRDSLVLTNNTQTLESFYQSEITRLGSETAQKDAAAEAGRLFLNQLQLRRESVSGVSLDEELANMVKFQQSLQASARFINVMNETLNVIVNGLL